jgi:hypothetical protein
VTRDCSFVEHVQSVYTHTPTEKCIFDMVFSFACQGNHGQGPMSSYSMTIQSIIEFWDTKRHTVETHVMNSFFSNSLYAD